MPSRRELLRVLLHRCADGSADGSNDDEGAEYCAEYRADADSHGEAECSPEFGSIARTHCGAERGSVAWKDPRADASAYCRSVRGADEHSESSVVAKTSSDSESYDVSDGADV